MAKAVNMQLSNQAIKEFKNIYFIEVGENISNDQANILGIKLLRLFQVIYRPKEIINKKLSIINKKNE